METLDVTRALHETEKRAERVKGEHVVATYVETGGLIDALMSRDNGIIYGRRGTGKTHALKYQAEQARDKGEFVIYVDIEQDVGSTEGLYSDHNIPVSERATRLLIDVLNIVHERLLEDAFAGNSGTDISLFDRILDHFGQVVVAVEGEEEQHGEARTLCIRFLQGLHGVRFPVCKDIIRHRGGKHVDFFVRWLTQD